jgi:tRNA-2-methylthio-N6-dimethylallyladenosine synthase
MTNIKTVIELVNIYRDDKLKKMKTYHIITIGCQMNKSDSERIAFYLDKLSFIETSERKKADFVFINTCGIRQSAEDRIYGLIPKIKKDNHKVKIIITGCLSQRRDVINRLKNKVDFWMPITDLKNLAGLLNGEKTKKSLPCDYLNLEAKIKSKYSVYIPIGNGCNNFCSYCVVPYARGREAYRKAPDIIRDAKKFINRGYKELIFIAQNVNSYKSPGNEKYDFADLLSDINDLKGDFWIRFSTSHPKDMTDKLIATIGRCDKICSQIHLPAQSGDNKILEKMNRKYTIEHYKKLINKIKNAKSGFSFTTDIIVGFPGETKRQFNNTAKLFRETKFDMAYISKYSPRPLTKAYDMENNVSNDEKKKREELLNNLLEKSILQNNKNYLGSELIVLLESKTKNNFWQGFSQSGKSLKISSKEDLSDKLGSFIKVKIIGLENLKLIAKAI